MGPLPQTKWERGGGFRAKWARRGAEGLEGEISVKATRNAGLAGAALACMLQPGEWLSDLRLSVGGERVQDLSYEMAPDQRLLDLTVGVLAQVFLGFGGHLCCHRVL